MNDYFIVHRGVGEPVLNELAFFRLFSLSLFACFSVCLFLTCLFVFLVYYFRVLLVHYIPGFNDMFLGKALI